MLLLLAMRRIGGNGFDDLDGSWRVKSDREWYALLAMSTESGFLQITPKRAMKARCMELGISQRVYRISFDSTLPD